MQIPALLKQGDIIGVYSPSGSVVSTAEELKLYERGILSIQQQGFNILESKHARTQFHHMSADGKQKAEDIHELFRDNTVAGLFPSVGGHSASQILEYLDLKLIEKNPKALVAFSDSSMLAAFITDRTGLVTYHSAVDIMFGFSRFGTDQCPMMDHGNYTQRHLWSALCEGIFPRQYFSRWVSLIPGECEGILLGGNLHSLEQLIGTRYEPDWSEKIMFWEAGDPPHKIGQMLSHFRNAGILKKLSGMLIGKVSHLKEDFYRADEIMPTFELIAYHLRDHSFPVIADADIGHDVENITIPNGRLARLRAGEECLLELL